MIRDQYVVTIRPRRLLAGAAAALLAAVVLAALAFVFRAPLLTWVGGQLIHVDSLVRSDAIVVLAGGSPMRELEAADLYRAGWASRLVLTQEPEPPVHAELRHRGLQVETAIQGRLDDLRDFGVPRDAVIVLDGTVMSTAAEAEVVAAAVERARFRSIIVVTSPFHTARARFIFGRVLGGSDVQIRYRGSSADPFTAETWWQNRGMLREGLIEWQKTVFYRLRY